ncbi:sll1863 family stress response protein [Roseovarius salinarum]|uniref:coiled coil domain-containing protein n=1 Tax=Roseovarius salinarum TaxID=1981892 RepID=UPI000C333054|nr:coiled coil domain-containing protein [Roseovarius salinarum]
MDDKDDFQERLNAQLDAWRAEIAQLEAKAKEAHGEAQQKYLDQIEDLREYQREAEIKLNEIRATNEAAWQDIKSGYEAAWNEIANSMKKALSRFD